MSNYKGIVAKIERIVEIEKAENIQIAVVLGEFTIVSKSIGVGTVGILFPAGTQLSEAYCHENNLYRDPQLNKDTTQKGFFEENRKVRCQKFLGVKSEAYFASINSVDFTGTKGESLELLSSFEELNGVTICNKFLLKQEKEKKEQKNKAPRVKSVPFFKEHVDTEQFKHNLHKLNKGDLISIQSKRHGTSQRSGIQLVRERLPKWKEWFNKWYPIFRQKDVYQSVVGTRRTVLTEPEKEGFHGSEAFRFEIANKLKEHLTEGITLYYEVFGWANGKPIMPKHNMDALKNKEYVKKYGKEITYAYGCLVGTYDYHIYRITYTTHTGTTVDLTQAQLVSWCKDRNLNHSLDVVPPFIYDGDQEKLKVLVEELTERPEVLTEDFTDPRHPSEGVIVRVDRGTTTPLFLKSKSFVFKCLEGIAQEIELDIEDAS
jgi:hypothetical protein